MTFHHIGYAVHDIYITSRYYVQAGWHQSNIQIDEIQNVKIAFLTKNAFPPIELVAPVNEQSPIVKTLQKSGISPYHICYETDDIEQSIKELKKQHFLLLFKPIPAVAFGNRKICYLYNKDVGLIEILEK
jgi:methylmalonyl-CoA/ethylmalonyl-CoA epimerase